MTMSLTEFNSIAYLFPNFKEILEKEEQPIEALMKIDNSGKLLVDLYEQTTRLHIRHISETNLIIKKLSEKIVNAFSKDQAFTMSMKTFNPTEEQNKRFQKIYASFVQSPATGSVAVAVMAPTASSDLLAKQMPISQQTKQLKETARLQKEQVPVQPGDLIIEKCKNFFLQFGRGTKEQNRTDEINFYDFINNQISLQDLRVARDYIRSLEDLSVYVTKIETEIGNPSHKNINKLEYASWSDIFTHYRNWMFSIIVARINQINTFTLRSQQGCGAKV